MPDVLVTGLPRSGLTLAAALIDSLPNSVCLNSPQQQSAQARKLQETIPFAKWLAGDFIWHRSRLLSQDAVNDYRASDGSPLLDTIKDPRIQRDESGKAKLSSFTRAGLIGDFTLAMKHDALYTCLLPTLVEMSHFKIIAIIRHPYDVLTSWQSLPDEPYAQGKIPFARHYWHEAALMDPEKSFDKLERMVQIYEMFLGRYYELRDHITILKYEDMIDQPVLLSRALGYDIVPPGAPKIVRKPHIHSSENLGPIRERLQKTGVFVRHFYSNV